MGMNTVRLVVLEVWLAVFGGALQLNDGRILSWGNDCTLRLWDSDGRPLAVLDGHTGNVNGALQLNDGRILSWSDDYTLRIWDSDDGPLLFLTGIQATSMAPCNLTMGGYFVGLA